MTRVRGGTRLVWAVTAVVAAAVVALRLWVPGDEAPGLCPIRTCTGVACPGCGLTRAVAHLIRGDFAAMWAMHPLAPLIVVEGVVALAIAHLAARRRVRVPPAAVAAVGAVHIALLVVVWVARFVAGSLPV